MTHVLLLSTYELGHQPFGLASPAAWFKNAGAEVNCLDLAVQKLDSDLVRWAELIAIYLPMHTATRLASAVIPRLKKLNPTAHIACYGLYAAANEQYLRELGVDSLFGGEFEAGLVDLLEAIRPGSSAVPSNAQKAPSISMARQQFLVPDREMLPKLSDYAQLLLPDGRSHLVGYTEASRGCKHFCRHCPVVPIYNGRFRIVQPAVVLADIRQQVEKGAQHITFGDPDFFNGPGHAIAIVNALHREFPNLTYDATIKIEHLLKHDQRLPILRDTGCLFITSAVEEMDDQILVKMDKKHTRSDFYAAAARLRELGLALNPTFIPFTPWTTVNGYLQLLASVRDLDLVNNVAPIQYAIRLLIPSGSLLLDLPEIRDLVEPFDQAAFSYPWRHPDPAIDQLYERVFRLVQQNQNEQAPRSVLFNRLWQTVEEFAALGQKLTHNRNGWDLASNPVPHLSEPWYC